MAVSFYFIRLSTVYFDDSSNDDRNFDTSGELASALLVMTAS